MDKHLELITRSRMQEAPPSNPSSEQNLGKHQVRFYLFVIFIALILVPSIWLIIVSINSGEWFQCTMAAYAVFMTVLLSPSMIVKMHANARIETLIRDFLQTSDRFSRPRIYRHKVFNPNTSEVTEANSFVQLMSVSSDGHFILPEMTKGPFNCHTDIYSVNICIGDDVLSVTKDQNYHWYTKQDFIFKFIAKHSGEADKIAHFRITKRDMRSNVVTGDFSISGAEFDGFMKTIELAKYFDKSPKR